MKVSEGCAHCYAEARDRRHLIEKVDHWGPGAPRRKVKGFEDNARALDRRAVREGRRLRVFPSVCDPFDAEVPIEWFVEFLDVIRTTPNLDWLLLTKRPELWWGRLRLARAILADPGAADVEAVALHAWIKSWLNGAPPANVWTGASMENQKWADKRLPELIKIPALVRFLSVEPMLGAVHFSDVTNRSDWKTQLGKPALSGIHWVICGGESGIKYRPMKLEWARSVRDQCSAVGVPFFMKQLGGWPDKRHALEDFPEDLRVREWPALAEVAP